MDNTDFDKHFSDQLNEEQDFNFQESDWNDLSDRMAGQNPKRRRFILPFWLAAAGSILLGSIFYLWYSNRMTNAELQELRSEILKLNEKKSTDTIYEKIVVYKTDTIYQNSALSLSKGQNNKLKTKNQELQTANQKPRTANQEPGTISNNIKPVPPSVSEEQAITSHQSPVSNHQSPVPSLQNIPSYAESEASMPELDLLPVKLKDKPVKKRVKLDPGGQLGISAGWGFVDVHKARSNNLVGSGYGQPSIFKQSSYAIGLQGEFLFNEKLRLTGGVFYERLKLNVENYLSVQNIPDAEAINADTNSTTVNLDEYNNADVLQQTLNYEFGLKYVFAGESKWSPYLGAAILGQSNLKRNIKYASADLAGSYSVRIEDLNTSPLASKPVFFYGLRASIGTEYSLSDHFGLHAETYYNYAFKTFEDRHLNLFGARAGVYYKF